MNGASLWYRVHAVWRRSNITIRPGAAAHVLSAFEEKYGVVFPADVREYFLASGGTGGDMDKDMFRFWPLAEVQPVHDVLVSDTFTYADQFAYPNCFAFADYCINCLIYAVKLTNDPTQPAPVFRVTGLHPPGEQMTPSFREFMERYSENPNSII